jgi:hypothetical protein
MLLFRCLQENGFLETAPEAGPIRGGQFPECPPYRSLHSWQSENEQSQPSTIQLFEPVQTSSRHMHLRFGSAAWGRAARASARSMLRFAIHVLAVAGAVVGLYQVMFVLTATCVIRKDQSQFVLARVNLERLGQALEIPRGLQRAPATANGVASLGSQSGRERLERPVHQTVLNRPMGTAIHI